MTVYVKQAVIASLKGTIPLEVIQKWIEKKEIAIIEENEKDGN